MSSQLQKPMLMSTTLSFIQLSDPHLSSLQDVHYRQLLSKRVLGYLSWRKHRRHEHRPEVLAALRDDIANHSSDHILITGDLTHISLPHEFIQAQQWLASLGQPSDVTVIPGNHDTYVSVPWEQGLGRWQPYMQSDHTSEVDFPILRIRASVAFIGLSTAVPTPPFFATGRIGQQQLAKLEQLLQQTKEQGLFRVVFLHHPPIPGQEKWRKRLIDAPALCATLARTGAELVLHGHSHRAITSAIDVPGASSIPVWGIPSSSAIGLKPGRAAQYLHYTVCPIEQGWQLNIRARDYMVNQHRFVDGHAKDMVILKKK